MSRYKILSQKTASVHETIVKKKDNFFKRIEDNDGIRWFIENKGIWDEQSPNNMFNLEVEYQEKTSPKHP